MDSVTNFDAIVIGAGQAGPPLAKRLTKAGMSSRRRRTPSVRRHLCEHGLHSDQGDGGQRLRRALARRAEEFGVGIDGSVTVEHAAR